MFNPDVVNYMVDLKKPNPKKVIGFLFFFWLTTLKKSTQKTRFTNFEKFLNGLLNILFFPEKKTQNSWKNYVILTTGMDYEV